ncbi:ribonuclease domain-containing protein [Luteimonas lutimaris]|uniref:Ribonuclease n=1 Tax=Luteimonas lutimaris TaxID=698645 RepID=A0ABP7M1Q4_9GAMM
MRRNAWLIVALVLASLWAWSQFGARAPAPAAAGTPAAGHDAGYRGPGPASRGYPAWLPAEALDTLALIERGGPFPNRQDGGTFQNRERLLPKRPRGYYREYTVRTPGSRDRGARRIVSGGRPPAEFFYTDDHYRSFRRFTPAEPGQ